MTQPWHRPLMVFALFNLIAVPLAGRATWVAMQALNADGAIAVAVLVSVLAALAILAVNALTTLWAGRTGVPPAGWRALWVVTGVTFALTVGTGFFSPLTLLQALVTA